MVVYVGLNHHGAAITQPGASGKRPAARCTARAGPRLVVSHLCAGLQGDLAESERLDEATRPDAGNEVELPASIHQPVVIVVGRSACQSRRPLSTLALELVVAVPHLEVGVVGIGEAAQLCALGWCHPGEARRVHEAHGPVH